MKEISLKETVYQIINHYPELKGILVEIGFTPLQNPSMVNTVGRMMPLGKGARRAGVSVETIAQAIEPYGYVIKERKVRDKPNPKSRRAEEMESRQQVLKDLILRLHDGEDQEVIKAEFQEHFAHVSAFEISMMERRLMGEGIEAEEIMRLCNIHASLFAGSVKPAEHTSKEMEKAGHPLRVLKEENLALESTLDRIERLLQAHVEEPAAFLKDGLLKQSKLLWEFDKHYARKENSIFPVMERYGILAPPKVMWGVDDEIRELYKQFEKMIQQDQLTEAPEAFAALKHELMEMIVKEEDIMIPMVQDIFNEDDWLKIAEESEEIGYCIVKPEAKWIPERTDFDEESAETAPVQDDGNLPFKVGYLTMNELENMLNLLPLELTFVDANDTVKYINNGKDRKIFPRTKSSIGRQVQNCHPPKSLSIVNQLLKDLKSGKKDKEILWFHAHDHFVMVTYCAVRNDDGSYAGTLEYVQDIQPIKDLEGEKKLIEVE